MPTRRIDFSKRIWIEHHVARPDSTDPTPAPICLLNGWTAGSPTILDKAYAKRYLQAGFHVVCLATPGRPPTVKEANSSVFPELVGSRVWMDLFKACNGGRVVVHNLSGGGTINFAHLLRLTEDGPVKLREAIKCIVFDSVPGDSSVKNLAEFTLSTTLPGGGADPALRTTWVVASAYLNAVPRMVAMRSTTAMWRLKRAVGLPVAEEEEPLPITGQLPFHAVDYPNVDVIKFIYSRKDRLTNFVAVDNAMVEMKRLMVQRGRRTKIIGKFFEESEHVGHAARYPVEYWTEVGQALVESGFEVEGGKMIQMAGTTGVKARL